MRKEKHAANSWMGKAALFLLSQSVSIFGSSVTSFAIIWYITLETSSGVWMMMSTICSMLPQVFVSLFAGVLADRYSRKRIIMLADGFIALATLLLAIAFQTGMKSLWLLLAASVIRSIGSGFQTPAVNALYPQIVPKEKLGKIMGINQTLNSALMLLSPAMGGVLLGAFGVSAAFFLDVGTAIIGIGILSLLRIPKMERAPSDEQPSVLRELREGVSFTFQHRVLRVYILAYALFFFFVTPAAFLTPVLVERSFGNEVWRLTANEISWTAGSLLGGAFVALHGEFKRKIPAMCLSIVWQGITYLLLGLAPHFTLYLAINVVSGLAVPLISTTSTVLIQRSVDDAMMGRVFSIVQIIAAGCMPLGMLVFGPLADLVSVELILMVSGGLLALIGVLLLRFRKLEDAVA